jgi:glycosyltransferase involved in cell wall biosynthesis
VVTTPVPAVVELVGDGAALFRPGDVDGLTATLCDLLGDEAARAALARRGADRVRGLRWQATAQATAAVYRSLGLAV